MKSEPIYPFNSVDNLIDQSTMADQLKQRLKLEGQCKIQQIQILNLSYLKIIFLLVPTILSIVGIFLMKYYISIRVKLFYYQSNISDATHIYIRGLTRTDSEIVKISYKGQRIFFFYRKLKYELINNKAYPMAANLNQILKKSINPDFLKIGLKDQVVLSNRYLFGLNQHIVDPPTYYEYLYQVLTQPFFFIQYLAATIYIIVKLPQLSFLLLGSSVLTTSINYLLLYISYRKIKQISEISINVQVIRNRQSIIIPSNQIVPGDLFVPKDQMCCDAIIIKGQVYVNQSNLTGESVPIGKYGLGIQQNWVENDNSKWIYEGSKILSSSNPLAIAIYTGYTTKRGQILRKILNRPVLISELFKSCLYFLLFTYIIGATLYLTTLSVRIQNGNLQSTMIFLNFLLIVTQCFPPGCPIYFNLVYSFCLTRLKFSNILGAQPQKTIQSAHLKVMCFDKTGTLTQEKMEIVNIYKFYENYYKQIKDSPQQQKLDFKLFGSCHTVQFIDGEYLGDEIDLKMMKKSPYLIKAPTKQNVFFEVQTQEGTKFNNIQILKIFQYESRFQSMSVMVYDKQTQSHYIFVKGAPEMIHNNSVKKYSYFNDLLQTVSFRGFRCIAYGYKKLNISEIETYLHGNRGLFMKDINILGFLIFQNKLKSDANQTIELLRQTNIESKIITGDNIYIAIETSIRCGILNRNQQITIIEGHEQNQFQSYQIAQRKIHVKKVFFNSQKLQFQRVTISMQQYIAYQSSLVIDNDFLNKLSKDKLFLSDQIKVFCRISPQNKALIVRMFKQNIKSSYKKLTRIERIFSPLSKKIGMIGDGSNDLLAIRQADIGIGIKNCDSSYAASFSVQNLKHIDNIVREAKCAQRQIIQIIRFISITSFISVPVIIIMETQGAYFSSFQLIVGNLTKYIVINIFLALSRPSANQTKYNSCSNFMRLQNQLVYWGNVILGSLGHIAIMIYYRTQSQYQWNFKHVTTSSGWTSLTSLVSSQYLFYSVHPIALVLGIYISFPWKESIYKNYILFATILINIAIIVLLFAIFPQLQQFLGFVHISYKSLGYIALICTICSILVLIYNAIINSLNLHEKQFKQLQDNALLSQN